MAYQEYPKWISLPSGKWIVNDAETAAKLLAGTHVPVKNPVSAQTTDPVVHAIEPKPKD